MDSKRPIIIKKKVVHSGHHGGAWKVAYADFVTAMMALFIVLWLLTSNEKVREAVGGYFRDPSGRGKNPGTTLTGTGRDLSALKDDMSNLKEKLKSVIKLIPHFEQMKGNVELTITEEGLRIELLEGPQGLFFETGRPEPSPLGKEVLVALAKELGRIPNHILIEGHTDAIPYGDNNGYSNWELSADRANQARRLMEDSGLAPNQVGQIRGFADQELRNKENPKDPSNRRVSMIVKYLDTPTPVKVGSLGGKAKQSEERAQINPAGLEGQAAVAAEHKAPEHK
jgi:chemotaxis protein MotB